MKKSIKIILIIVLIIIFLLLLFLFCGKLSYSKYKSKVNSSAVGDIAKPVFEVEGLDSIKIDGVNDSEYNFSVKNYKDNEKSDVDLEYYIEITNNSEANLSFKLLNSKNRTVKLDRNNKSAKFTLDSANKQKDDYKLVVTYKSSESITDIEGNVQVKVEAIQSQEVR